ncbi:MAG: FAD-binding protein, partial [Polyangiaceae bacterium]
MPLTTDYLVIGSGVAGLTFALEAAAHGDVTLITKRSADESNTKYAQGGIAAVLSTADSFAAHIADTLTAGAGLCHERTVEIAVKEGPARVRALQDIGARFDLAEGARGAETDLDLHLEGGHSARRVAHAADMTGREVERALLDAVKASARVRILENHCAVDLITLAKYGGPEVCAGAYVLDEESGQVATVLARAVVLASGGAGKVYLYTTNPDVATGDGVAMAYRAGAEIANLEFY